MLPSDEAPWTEDIARVLKEKGSLCWYRVVWPHDIIPVLRYCIGALDDERSRHQTKGGEYIWRHIPKRDRDIQVTISASAVVLSFQTPSISFQHPFDYDQDIIRTPFTFTILPRYLLQGIKLYPVMWCSPNYPGLFFKWGRFEYLVSIELVTGR